MRKLFELLCVRIVGEEWMHKKMEDSRKNPPLTFSRLGEPAD